MNPGKGKRNVFIPMESPAFKTPRVLQKAEDKNPNQIIWNIWKNNPAPNMQDSYVPKFTRAGPEGSFGPISDEQEYLKPKRGFSSIIPSTNVVKNEKALFLAALQGLKNKHNNKIKLAMRWDKQVHWW